MTRDIPARPLNAVRPFCRKSLVLDRAPMLTAVLALRRRAQRANNIPNSVRCPSFPL
jgi:hypothetical protein